MAVIRVEPSITVYNDDGTNTTVALNTIPQAGCEATARWLATQLKPNPLNPNGPPVSIYAYSPTDTAADILKNLANTILGGKIAEFASSCPSAAVIAKQEAVRDAVEDLENQKKIEAGLLTQP